MLEEVSLPHMLDALEHEGETRNHQRDEIPERASGLEHTCSNVFITTQVKPDQRSTCQ